MKNFINQIYQNIIGILEGFILSIFIMGMRPIRGPYQIAFKYSRQRIDLGPITFLYLVNLIAIYVNLNIDPTLDVLKNTLKYGELDIGVLPVASAAFFLTIFVSMMLSALIRLFAVLQEVWSVYRKLGTKSFKKYVLGGGLARNRNFVGTAIRVRVSCAAAMYSMGFAVFITLNTGFFIIKLESIIRYYMVYHVEFLYYPISKMNYIGIGVSEIVFAPLLLYQFYGVSKIALNPLARIKNRRFKKLELPLNIIMSFFLAVAYILLLERAAGVYRWISQAEHKVAKPSTFSCYIRADGRVVMWLVVQNDGPWDIIVESNRISILLIKHKPKGLLYKIELPAEVKDGVTGEGSSNYVIQRNQSGWLKIESTVDIRNKDRDLFDNNGSFFIDRDYCAISYQKGDVGGINEDTILRTMGEWRGSVTVTEGRK